MPDTYPCHHCGKSELPDGEIALEQYDRYRIYAGRWHTTCWERFGYGDFIFDSSYAGERLEEDA